MDSIDNKNDGALLRAIKNGEVETVRQLLQDGADANQEDGHETPVLYYAIRHNQLEIAKLLLEWGADIKKTDEKKNHVLHLLVGSVGPRAVQMTGKEIVEFIDLLVFYKVDINAVDNDGRSFLQRVLAYYTKQKDRVQKAVLIVESLIKHNVNVDTKIHLGNQGVLTGKEGKEGELAPTVLTALEFASINGQLKIARLLLERLKEKESEDIPVEEKQQSINNALHRVVKVGESKVLDVIHLLVEYGADVNAEDINGYTPLQNAVLRNECFIGEALVRHGADIEKKNSKGRNALDVVEYVGQDGVFFNRWLNVPSDKQSTHANSQGSPVTRFFTYAGASNGSAYVNTSELERRLLGKKL